MSGQRALLSCLAVFLVALIAACGGGGKPAAQAPGSSDGKDQPADQQAGPKADAETEVRRLFEERLQKNNEEHAAAVTKYEADLMRFDEAMETYKREVAEYPAKATGRWKPTQELGFPACRKMRE